MTKKEMINAWKNPEARLDGVETPVGNVELSDDDLNSVAGGAEGTHAWDTMSCCTTSKYDTGHCCEGKVEIAIAR